MENELLPTGFRFYPTEEELVSFYLHNKLNNTRPEIDRVIPVLDIYDHNPSDLPNLGGDYCPADGEQWFFFIPRREREARGGRPNRLTARGYWKATGSPADVYSSRNHGVIGRKRTMVFYVGRAPYGNKTVWKMIEYKAIVHSDHDQASSSSSFVATVQLREELSLCRIYKRSKCLRAFDRRPPPFEAAVTGGQAALHYHHHHRRIEAAGTLNNNHQVTNNQVLIQDHIITTACSLDSSSSEDHNTTNYQSQAMESTNKHDMGIDNEPLCDNLEELNKWVDVWN